MPRKMSDPSYRKTQWNHRYDSHIAPINHFVDKLRDLDRGEVPYVAPIYGGVNARLLSILRDPGPMTQSHSGSGFLSMENDDATAEKICNYYSDAGIDAKEILPWNAYPWYINRAPKALELEQSVEPLFELINMLPRLRVVMLHGGSAKNIWKRLTKRYQNLELDRNLCVVETYHTSNQAFWHKDPEVREQRKEHLKNAFAVSSKVLSE